MPPRQEHNFWIVTSIMQTVLQETMSCNYVMILVVDTYAGSIVPDFVRGMGLMPLMLWNKD